MLVNDSTTITAAYLQRKQSHIETVGRLKKKFNVISFLRLLSVVCALTAVFFAIRYSSSPLWITAGTCFAVFLLFMRFHGTIRKQLSLAETLVKVNSDELAFLETDALPFYDGAAFNEQHHLYTYDLDVFGPHSLFHHLNRTQTVMGKQHLAAALRSRSPDETITHRQEAVRELAGEIDLRQEFTAKAHLANDSEKLTAQLLSWTHEPAVFPKTLAVLSYLLPVTSAVLITDFILTHNPLFLHFTVTVFILNLVALGSQLRKMNREITHADTINTTVLRYSQLLKILEAHNWQSHLLQMRQRQLMSSQKTASGAIHELSRIFADLESLQNGFGAIILNGAMLYHLHAYRKLLRWKSTHAKNLTAWLEVIGETEMLLSFANLSFNNPEFCFPELNIESRIAFEEMGHPLIPARKRVTNSVVFTEQPFIILTGSNMSGKSTFLRTLGINFVLANAGAPVCAKAAAFHPMEIVVSMRLSDSLTDSESYFFAEVKRLKEMMDKLDKSRCFVLLDEILRGTNSDDKRSGTIAVVKNVLLKNAIGAIATHDLEVCQTTNDYPDKLVNKCFEVEITDNDLHFDYKLRDGICRNKSATFLMTKMGVI